MKCFCKDALPSNYFYYLCSKFGFISYPMYSWHNKKQRTHVNVLLFASWHLLKSIICSNTIKEEHANKQNNGHKSWIYFSTINNELFRDLKQDQLLVVKNNKFLVLQIFQHHYFLYLWHTFVFLYWFKITCRTGKRTSINYKINEEKRGYKYHPWKLRTFIYHEFTKYNIIFSQHNGICFLHLWWAKNSKGYALIITMDGNYSLFLQKSSFKDLKCYLTWLILYTYRNSL